MRGRPAPLSSVGSSRSVDRPALYDDSEVIPQANDWVAVTGLLLVDPNATTTLVPDVVMEDPRLSLAAKGLYAVLLSYQGQPIDPYEDAIEGEEEIRVAIDELVACGYAVRVRRVD